MENNVPISFKAGNSANLPNAKKMGTLYFTEDKKIYFDINDTTRIMMNELSKGTDVTASKSLSFGDTFTAITDTAVDGHIITDTTTTYTMPTYSAATTAAAGLMSAADKVKLDGIATGANNYTYTLPTASSSTLGGVKTTSTVTSTSGLTACPIIGGVPYYKDTNNTYNLSSFGITATAAELNKMDGVTATTAQINYLNGVTSSIQTQLNRKLSLSGGNVTGNIILNNSIVLQAKDSSGTARNLIYLSESNKLHIGWGFKDLPDYAVQLNGKILLTSMTYGTDFPTTGLTTGRVFFKKVSG